MTSAVESEVRNFQQVLEGFINNDECDANTLARAVIPVMDTIEPEEFPRVTTILQRCDVQKDPDVLTDVAQGLLTNPGLFCDIYQYVNSKEERHARHAGAALADTSEDYTPRHEDMLGLFLAQAAALSGSTQEDLVGIACERIWRDNMDAPPAYASAFKPHNR